MKALHPNWMDVAQIGELLTKNGDLLDGREPPRSDLAESPGIKTWREPKIIEVQTPRGKDACRGQPCLLESPKQPNRKDKRILPSSQWGVQEVNNDYMAECGTVKGDFYPECPPNVHGLTAAEQQRRVVSTPHDHHCGTPSEPPLKDGRQSRRSSNGYLTHSTFHLTQQTPPLSQPDTAGVPWCAVEYTPEKEKRDSQSGSPISSVSRESLSTEKNPTSHCRHRIFCRSCEGPDNRRSFEGSKHDNRRSFEGSRHDNRRSCEEVQPDNPDSQTDNRRPSAESPPNDHQPGLPVLSESENAFSYEQESGRSIPPMIALEKAVGTEDLRTEVLRFSYTPEKLEGFELWESPDWKNFHSHINWEGCGPYYGNTVIFRRFMRKAYFGRPALWKGWDGKHFPPTNFFEAAVIWFTVDAARNHVECITLARSHKDDEWRLAGRHDLRKGPEIMKDWVQINYWWLVKNAQRLPASAQRMPVVYLDPVGKIRRTPLSSVPDRESCHEIRIASLHHLRARIEPFIRRKKTTQSF